MEAQGFATIFPRRLGTVNRNAGWPTIASFIRGHRRHRPHANPCGRWWWSRPARRSSGTRPGWPRRSWLRSDRARECWRATIPSWWAPGVTLAPWCGHKVLCGKDGQGRSNCQRPVKSASMIQSPPGGRNGAVMNSPWSTKVKHCDCLPRGRKC